jgi:hypothetical protein
MDGSRRVIVGVNGSVRNVQALRCAAAEARARDAVLVAVHAWVPPGGTSPSACPHRRSIC